MARELLVTADTDTRLLALEDIVPWEANPRIITKERLESLKRSLAARPDFLWDRPCLVQLSRRRVYAGNQRYHSAVALVKQGQWPTDLYLIDGRPGIPGRVRDITDEEAEARAVIDNNTWGEWQDDEAGEILHGLKDGGFAIEDFGFESKELDRMLAGVGSGIDTGDPEDKEPLEKREIERRAQTGQLWSLGQHKLYVGDCTDDDSWLRLGVQHHSADMTFTSLPYGVGVDYGEYQDTFDNLKELLARLPQVLADHTAPGGFAVMNFGDIVPASGIVGAGEPAEYPMALEYYPAFRQADWLLYTRRIWAKPHGRVNAPWVIGTARASSDWEHLWTFKRPGTPLVTRGEFTQFGVWDTSREEDPDFERDEFGASMPVMVAVRAVASYSRAGRLVLEPCAGTGTTIMASQVMGRRCRAVEIDPKACDLILERWERATGRRAELEDGDG